MLPFGKYGSIGSEIYSLDFEVLFNTGLCVFQINVPVDIVGFGFREPSVVLSSI